MLVVSCRCKSDLSQLPCPNSILSIQKTKVVLNPLISVDQSVVNETDLAGPLVIIIALGSMLLLSGKMHFGYIYGISIFAVLQKNHIHK